MLSTHYATVANFPDPEEAERKLIIQMKFWLAVVMVVTGLAGTTATWFAEGEVAIIGVFGVVVGVPLWYRARRQLERLEDGASGGDGATIEVTEPRQDPLTPEKRALVTLGRERPWRTWLQIVVPAVAVISACAACFIYAAVSDGSKWVGLGIVLLFPAVAFAYLSVAAWRGLFRGVDPPPS